MPHFQRKVEGYSTIRIRGTNIIYTVARYTVYMIQFMRLDTSHQLLCEHATEHYDNWWRVASGGLGWSGRNFYFRSINVVFCVFFARGGSTKRVLAQLTLPRETLSVRRRDRSWHHLASYMDIILSKLAVLEAEWLLPCTVTIVRETSATSSSQSLTIHRWWRYDREPERSRVSS